MDSRGRAQVRAQRSQMEKLKKRIFQLEGSEQGEGSRRMKYLFRMSMKMRSPRDLLRWYSNDSMV